jgi:inner membrane protein YidH
MPTEATPDRHTELAANRTAEAAERTKETAVRTTVAAQRTEASADRRTELAANRTVLAAERTYAAWVRTGLAALASGVGAQRLLSGVIPEWGVRTIGSVLVLFSAFSFGAAVWREVFTHATPPKPSTHKIHWIVLVVVNGSLILVAFGALVSVILGRTGG